MTEYLTLKKIINKLAKHKFNTKQVVVQSIFCVCNDVSYILCLYSKFTEFKFKIIHNVLPCGKQLCRWNNNYSGLCVYCGEVENITHLLYECSRIKNIWRVVSNCMKTNILLKHIIIGFQFNNENYVLQNKIICIVIISYAIYSVWCKCNINNIIKILMSKVTLSNNYLFI